MKKIKNFDTRRFVIIAIAIFTILIVREFVKAERSRKVIQYRETASKAGASYMSYYLPKNLVYRTEAFPQKAIDEFLNSDAEVICISERQVDREFAETIQKHYQVDNTNKTYFSVTSFLYIERVVCLTIIVFIYLIAYIVMSEIKEKRRANQSNNPM